MRRSAAAPLPLGALPLGMILPATRLRCVAPIVLALAGTVLFPWPALANGWPC